MYNTKGQSGKLIYSTFATLIQGSVFCFTIYINKHYTACLNITLFNEHDIYMDQKHTCTRYYVLVSNNLRIVCSIRNT